MNDHDQHSIEDYSADALMRVFSKSRLGMSVVAALLVHVVVIGALSIPMIIDGLTGEDEPEQPKTESEQRAEEIEQQAAEGGEEGDAEPAAEGEDAQGADAEGAADGEAPGDGAEAEGEAADGEEGGEGEEELSPVERRVQEEADPEEIPDEPDLGITIDETNP